MKFCLNLDEIQISKIAVALNTCYNFTQKSNRYIYQVSKNGLFQKTVMTQ